MKKKRQFWILISLFVLAHCKEKENRIERSSEAQSALTTYVDPFIGTGGHGHTYPGATTPFGMLQLSPDNGTNGWDWCSGYHYSDSLISGFSHLHLSGTGIGDLADILFMPVNTEIDLTKKIESNADLPYKSSFDHSSEEAHPGYYKVLLKDYNIEVELTATDRTAYHRYKFKQGDRQSVLVDLGFAINWDKPLETSLKLEDEKTLTGYRYSTGWAKNQKVFFVAKFSKPITSYTLVTDGKEVKAAEAKGAKVAVQLFFDDNADQFVQAKVAVSSVSIENARQNLNKDDTFDFNKVKEGAVREWEQALSAIKVETPVDSLKTIFYTALYHTQLSPVLFSDENGEFRTGNDTVAKAENYTAYSTFSLWDTFRAEQPLLTLIQPDKVADIINSMLAYYEMNHTLPVWTLYGNETNTMTGNHAIPVIAEAYLKGIRGFDAEKAYKAMKTTMMGDDRGLKFYKKYGYVPYNLMEESVTITLEFAYDDWCVAQMAQALGKEDDYNYFMKRSKAYQKVFDPETGFMRGKSEDGKSWNKPFDPKHSSHMTNTDYTEGNAWQHSWFVPQNPEGLIKLYGGSEKFTQKLEQLFTESSEITGENISADISGLIGQYAHGNEPSHHIVYLFNKAGKPWRTQYWVREILKSQYSTQPDGLSGNEDAGQMSAWYVFSSIGLYPFNPVSGEYEIGSPLYKKTVLDLPNGKTFTITAKNVSDKNIYIQSALLNDKTFNQTSISHKEILAGGVLKLQMGADPNKKWGISGRVNEP